jgi:CRP/FNR family transcriptional regulator
MYLETAIGGSATARPGTCANCAAREQSICAALGEGALGDFFQLGRTYHLKRGETLMWQSDEAILVGNLREGLLKLTASLDDGREQILGLAFPGDFVGSPYGETDGHCVTALTDAKLCVFRRSAFDQFAGCHPELEHALLLRTLSELERARRWMLLLGRKSAGERVATLLLEFADRQRAREGERVALPLTRQQMADLLGLTIETVSRKLTLFKKEAIRLPDLHSFVIVDRGALEALSGG